MYFNINFIRQRSKKISLLKSKNRSSIVVKKKNSGTEAKRNKKILDGRKLVFRSGDEYELMYYRRGSYLLSSVPPFFYPHFPSSTGSLYLRDSRLHSDHTYKHRPNIKSHILAVFRISAAPFRS
jgi:hypothetical protein